MTALIVVDKGRGGDSPVANLLLFPSILKSPVSSRTKRSAVRDLP
jgi:hypothetical protein